MQWSLLVFSLTYLFTSSSGQLYSCNGIQTINPPTNISIPWLYPTTWNSSDSPPQFAMGQNCTWKINVPKGMFAYFAMKANVSTTARLQMTDSTGYITTYTLSSLEPFYLMDPSFTVTLLSADTGSMGMRVHWYNVAKMTPATINVAPNRTPFVLSIGDFDAGTTIQSTTKVSLLSIPPVNQLTDLTPYMRITQVYDGPTTNSTLLGNLYQIMASGKNLVSSGTSLTLFSVFPGFNVGNVAVVQDYFDVKQFNSYKAIWCILPNLCDVSLDATKGSAAALRYSPSPFYVKTISLPQTNRLSVYTSFATDSNKLATYTQGNTLTNLPQKFRSTFTTFVLDQGQATVSLSSGTLDARWGIPFEGRHGFFASPYFTMDSGAQNFTEQIAGSQTYNISYTIDKAALNGGTYLQVTVFDGQTTSSDVTYYESTLPKNPVYSKGDNILVKYVTGGVTTTGVFVEFQFDKYNSASYLSFFLIIALLSAITL